MSDSNSSISCPQGFWQDSTVSPEVIRDLESTIDAANQSASDAADSAAAAATSEANAASSALGAAGSANAASTSATNAASSAANAASSVSAAATSASQAATSATNAGNSANQAASSATNAAASVGQAQTAATNAANSASQAGTSATQAGTSASNAASSAAAAAASVAQIALPPIGSANAGSMLDVSPSGAWELQTVAQVKTNLAVPAPSASAPLMDGTAAVGSSAAFALGDHRHPTDTTRAPVDSPVFTTQATVSAASGDSSLVLNGAAGTNRYFRVQTAGSSRWSWGATNTGEGGGNTGSDWYLNRQSDGGAYLDSPITIPRSTGIVTLTDGLITPSVNGGQTGGLRNAIINGSFDYWQRAASFSNPANGIYTADRWLSFADGTGASLTISKQSTLSMPIYIDQGFGSYVNYNVTVAGSGGTYRQFVQRIENVRTFAGRTITISFWGNADASRSIQLGWAQVFGTGGSPSAQINGTPQAVTVTAGGGRYSATFAVPSIANKTLGTNNDSYLQIILYLPTNTVFGLNVTGFQVEPGTVATPFEWRPNTIEYSLCARYYQAGSQYIFSTASAVSWTGGGWAPFQVAMRTAPTITPSGINLGNATGPIIQNATNMGFSHYIQASAAGNYSVGYNYQAVAEL